jgi:hypothetical protein
MISDTRDGVDYKLALPIDGDLQAPLGPGLDKLVNGFLDSLLKVVYGLVPSRWWIDTSKIMRPGSIYPSASFPAGW